MSDEAWHEWRRNGLGGSEISGLLAPGKWSSPWSIWASKTGLIEPTESTDRQRIGKRMESVIAAEFEDARPGLYVVGEQTWCEHPEHSWARCTVDGFVQEHTAILTCDRVLTDEEAAALRAEFLESSIHRRVVVLESGVSYTPLPIGVFEGKTDSRFGWDEVPDNYRMQCLWNMGVTGLQHAFLAVMFAGFRFDVFEVAWDQAEWEHMLDVAGTFWHEHCLTGVPPLADGSEATADALARAYPEHVPGVEVALDDLAGELEQRDYLKAQRKEYDAALAEIDNAIKARMADAEVGTVGGVPVLTYRASERAGYTVPPATTRTLRAAAKPKERQPK